MIRRPPRSTPLYSSAASDVYERQAADGARYTSPQGVLDALIGRLSFDPLEFTRLSARDQVTALLDLVNLDVDLDTLAHQRQAAYDPVSYTHLRAHETKAN